MKRVEFRDGVQEVPDHVAQHLEAFETYQMTYAEAIRRMNDRFLTDKLNKAQGDLVAQHLARLR